jgi:hypothetical protein
MEPAMKQRSPWTGMHTKVEEASQEKRPVQDWETTVGKMIFYTTCATALWFFYWLNGIQYPC